MFNQLTANMCVENRVGILLLLSPTTSSKSHFLAIPSGFNFSFPPLHCPSQPELGPFHLGFVFVSTMMQQNGDL